MVKHATTHTTVAKYYAVDDRGALCKNAIRAIRVYVIGYRMQTRAFIAKPTFATCVPKLMNLNVATL